MGDVSGKSTINFGGTPDVFASVITLSTVRPERVDWLWPGRLPVGKLVLLDGDPVTGKSTLAIDLAARISTGSPWPDGAPSGEAGDALILSAEDGLADTIVPRLLAAGANLDRVHALTEIVLTDDDGKTVRVPPTLPRDVDRIEKIVTEYDVRLVVVDVLMAYLSGRVDSHRDQDVRGVLHPLASAADRTGASVVLIRHLPKSHGGNPLYSGGGSIGIVGAARAAYLVARDPEDEGRRIMATVKSNLGLEAPSLAYRLVGDDRYDAARIAWEGTTEHTAADLLRDRDDEEHTELTNARAWLVAYLTTQGGCAEAGETIKAAGKVGIATRTLQRARAKEKITTGKADFDGAWVWTLPGTAAEPRRQD